MAKGKHEAPKQPRKKAPTKKTAPERESKDTEKTGKRNRKRKGKNIILAVALIIILIAAAVAVFALLIGRGDTIHPNVTLRGVDLGGMSVTEAAEALDESGWTAMSDTAVTVKLPGGYSFTVSSDEAGLSLSSREAAEAAYSYGHTGSPFADMKAYFRCIGGKVNDADILSAADPEGVLTRISDALAEYNAMLEKGYTVDTEAAELRLVKGGEAIKIDADKLCEQIMRAFADGLSELEYTADVSSAEPADFSAIHEKIYAEAIDATYDKEKREVTASRVGVDFDVAEAQRLWDAAKAGELVAVPLRITQPKVSGNDLSSMLFADKLGAKTTVFKTSSEGRATNVELSAAKINGVILNPGEVFSFNDVVGKRTAEAGFKTAAAYAGGGVVQEIGGGICQTSSTLYCAALFSNLEIVTRSEHGFAVSYVPYGLDATVSWGGPEFRFKNNRDYPIKIVATTQNRELTVEIWGTDVDGSYVEMTNSVSTRYDKKYPTVAIGTDAVTYRCVYDKDGNLISRTLEARSYYSYHKEDIKWPASPSPEQSAEPTVSPETTPAVTEEVIPTEPILPPSDEPQTDP